MAAAAAKADLDDGRRQIGRDVRHDDGDVVVAVVVIVDDGDDDDDADVWRCDVSDAERLVAPKATPCRSVFRRMVREEVVKGERRGVLGWITRSKWGMHAC